MSDKWKAGSTVQEQINTLIGNAHPHLADICDDIVVIFKEKASRKGGRPILGKTSKAPSILSVLGDHAYEFVIELGADCWNNLKENERLALLDHQLCFIGGEEDDKTGEMKYYLTTPDVYYFSEEVDRNGSWREEIMPDGEPEEEGSDAPFLDPIT
jgi:hypothetical protein